MRNIVITGSASGIGAACKAQFQRTGDRVVGIDLSGADIAADLSTQSGRDAAIAATLAYTEGKIDGLILSAGLSGMYHPGDVTLSVNYFGYRGGCWRHTICFSSLGSVGSVCWDIQGRPGLPKPRQEFPNRIYALGCRDHFLTFEVTSHQ